MESQPPEMRASDADRERVAARLREGYAEGRLDVDEFEQRLTAAYASRTYGDLEPLLRDIPLPAESATAVARTEPTGTADRWRGRIGRRPTSRVGVAVLSGVTRRGAWVVPRRFTAFAFWGGCELDLREAHFEDREVVIRASAVMGGVDIVVPYDAEVEVRGIGIMGGYEHKATGAGAAGAPRIVITGLAFWAGVDVRRADPPAKGADSQP
ncbi:DUF1707 SHOCT-like domain-containing protein [Streptomyces alkaliterrae]|uniref:DUF1707 and DUF2154 domain-containing protein n=1 Tax=Streptomyces alkaliterrae TaxID=2213162 RepID=A0A5P0YV76_9ACTN|nr:DUF1707 domain-containing protein [Streptomyces alkaliterrae]MBB1254437.1 DUF1707 and DUF2154 domain-containing protein [Streptomyces alkaliterrae]MBB1260976.1 DUF1707 and DUF2154 domain-containing protein [Streptomyces alkaliterrae]MQS04195.1 DUF1707 domain-containing protein [Streptomyces alkaliterrae]